MNSHLTFLLLLCPLLFFSQGKLTGKYNAEYQIFTVKGKDSIYFVDHFRHGKGVFCNTAGLSSRTNYENNVEIESNEKCGLIDAAGNIVLSKEYDRIIMINDHIVKLRKDEKHWLYDIDLKKEISKRYSVISYFQDRNITLMAVGNLYGIIDLNGKEIIKPEYDIVSAYDKDIFIARKDDRYGCFTADGKTLLPFEYKNIESSDHFIFARNDGGYEVFDKAGTFVTHLDFRIVRELNENTIAVHENGVTYIYDLRNKKKISSEPYLDLAVASFDKNRGIHIHAYQKDGLYDAKSGFIDFNGKIILPIEYNIGNFREGFATIGKDNKYGFIDESKQIVIPLQFDRVWNFFNGTAKAVYHGKNVYIDTKGEILFESDLNPETMTENIGFFYEGMAIKIKNGKYGYVDRSGREVVPLIFDKAHEFKNGSALVSKNHIYYFIDKEGKRIE